MTLALLCGLAGACGGASGALVRAPAASSPTWTSLESPTTESLRGLSVVDPDVVWASGAHGTVLRSIDGGDSWTAFVVPGAESIDFRSLHAFDASNAVVIAAGAPARVFRTEDGGAHWSETYTRDTPGIFFDSLAFWDARDGLAIGDPLEAESGPRFALLYTHDAGAHWQAAEGPVAQPGEAAFAASNGCIALPAPGVALFATGGSVAHVFRSADGGGTWSSADAPVASGLASAGAFAIAFRDARVGYVVGGDYAAPSSPGSFARSTDGGASWLAGTPPRGFRSAVAIAPDALLVVGTTGSDLSRDEGRTWIPIGDEPFNAIAIAADVAFAVGPAGSLASLRLSE